MGCWRWSRGKLLDKLGWLSVNQLVFYHSVLQTIKTINTGVPKSLHQAVSGSYPRDTRSATRGQIRQDGRFTSVNTFKYRVMMDYNTVPENIRVGSTETIKKN